MLRAANAAARAAPYWAARRRPAAAAPRTPPRRTPRRALVAAAAPSANAHPQATDSGSVHASDSGGVAVPQLTLYDTMARAKRVFETRGGGTDVGLYCCGVTVYDYSHIGECR